MAEYEPDDSRIITQNKSKTPIEPARTGPREKEARRPVGPEKRIAKGDVDADANAEEQRWQVDEGAPQRARDRYGHDPDEVRLTEDGRPHNPGREDE